MKRLAPGFLVTLFAAALLLLVGEHVVSERPSRNAERHAAKTSTTTPSVQVQVHEEIAPTDAATRLAAACSRLARTSDDRNELEAELLAASPREVAQARPRLEALLRDRPELAKAAARAFDKLEDREALFAVSRALGEHTDDSLVRATLVKAASGEDAARREVALMALASARDAQVPVLASAALSDASAPPLVRAAGAFALSEDPQHTPPGAFAAARTLAATPGEDAHARAEALHLLALAPGPGDGELASGVLTERDATAELALAAARLAIQSGQDRASVARALATHKDEGGLCARAASKLGGLP